MLSKGGGRKRKPEERGGTSHMLRAGYPTLTELSELSGLFASANDDDGKDDDHRNNRSNANFITSHKVDPFSPAPGTAARRRLLVEISHDAENRWAQQHDEQTRKNE